MRTFSLGRTVEHDPRSRNFAFTAPVVPKTVFWGDSAPVLDQGDIGGCVGWTGADILNTDPYLSIRNAHNAGRYYTNADGLRFYELATHCDNAPGSYPPDDTGSSGIGLAKALVKLGYITNYTHCFTWPQFLSAISTQPVALGVPWTQAMFKPDRNGVANVGPLNDSTIVGGHEFMARGVDMERSLVLCRNHWTPTWDKKVMRQKLPGEFWLTFHDLQALLANQGDVTVLHGPGTP